MDREHDEDINRRALEERADRIRARLSATIGELARRRREFFDVRAQARRHPVSALGIGTFLTVAAFSGGALATYGIWRGVAARRHPVGRLVRLLSHPERLLAPPPPSLTRRIAGSILSGVAATLAEAAVRRLLLSAESSTSSVPKVPENGTTVTGSFITH